MSCCKFSLFLVASLFALSSYAEEAGVQKEVEKFTPKECLMSKYETTVTHEGELWGLVKKSLVVKKDVCQITVLNKSFFETSWKVDVCREPIHMKVKARGNLNVYKRKSGCESAEQSDYCDFWKRLKAEMEDQGLIFAEGEREKLSTSHGKVYCSYLLLRKYLGEGELFSKYEDPIDIYQAEKKDEQKTDQKSGNKGSKASDLPLSPQPSTPAKSEKVEAQGRF